MSSGRNILIALFLVVYVLILGLIVAHYRFPYSATAAYLKNRAEATGLVKIEFPEVETGIPFNIGLKGLNVGLAESNKIVWLLRSDEIKISIKPSHLLWGRIYGDWQAKVWGGKIRGSFEYKPFSGRDYYLALEEIDFPDFSFTRTAGQTSLVGPLRGQAIIHGRDQVFPTDGTGKITMGPGRFTGRLLPELPKEELAFDQLELKFSLTDRELTVESLSVDGPKIELRLDGKIVNFNKPVLELKGSIRFGSDARKASKLNFRLTGPLSKPRIGLGSQS